MSKSKAESRAEKAARIKAEQARRERNRRLASIGGVIAAMVLIVGGAIAFNVWNDNRRQAELESAAEAETGEFSFLYGSADAPNTVVIYEDFLCGHCATLKGASGAGLTEQADAGNVLLDYRPVAFLQGSDNAVNAFKAVLETDHEAAKEFQEALYADQANGPWSDEELVALAVASGVEAEVVRSDIEGNAYADWVAAATHSARDARVQGTPTVLLNGRVFSDGRSWEEIGRNLVSAVSTAD